MSDRQVKRIRREVRRAIARKQANVQPLGLWRRVMWMLFGR